MVSGEQDLSPSSVLQTRRGFASLSEPCRLAQKGTPMDLMAYNWFLYIAMAGVVAVAAVAWTVGKTIYEKVTRQDPPAE